MIAAGVRALMSGQCAADVPVARSADRCSDKLVVHSLTGRVESGRGTEAVSEYMVSLCPGQVYLR